MRVKKLTKLADDKQLKQEEGIGDTDTWNGYHGRQKQVRLRNKLYFKSMRRFLFRGMNAHYK